MTLWEQGRWERATFGWTYMTIGRHRFQQVGDSLTPTRKDHVSIMLFPALGHGEHDPLDRLNISRDGMFTASWGLPKVVLSIYAARPVA